MADYDGAFSVRTGYLLRLSVWLISQNVNTNESTMGWQYGSYKDGGSGWYNGYNDATHSHNLNGNTGGGSFGYDFTSYSYLSLGSGTFVVPHNADGTKTISVSASVDDSPAKPGGNLGTAGVSGSYVLPTIPRATTPTITPNPVDAGVATTIDLSSRASSSFTHELSYTFAGGSTATAGLSATSGVGTSATLTPPLALMNQIPNATSGVLVLTIVTKNGATTIGTRTVNITVTVPTSVRPTISSVTASEATTSPNLASIVGRFVRNLSRLNLAIVGAAGAYGSTITGYKITVAGQTINAVSGTTPSPINAAGTVTISAEVTDSRGRTSSFAGATITVLDYLVPQILTASVDRSNNVGVIDNSNGTYIRVNLNASVQSLLNTTERNELHYRVYTSPQGANTWTQRGSEVDTNALTFNSFFVITIGGPYPLTSAFDVLIRVIDELGIITDVQRTISTGKVVLDLNGSAGVGMGGYHQYGLLDVKGDIYQDGYPVLDHGDWASNAEVIAGLISNKVISPSTLAALTATNLRNGLARKATSVEARGGIEDTKFITAAGLRAATTPTQGQIPSSVSVSAGSASVAADGTITLTSARGISVNGVFDGLGADIYEIHFSLTQASVAGILSLRMRTGSTDEASAAYVWAAVYGTLSGGPSWTASSNDTAFCYLVPGASTAEAITHTRVMMYRPALAVSTWAQTHSIGAYSGNRTMWTEGGNAPGSTVFHGFSIRQSATPLISGTIKVVKVA